MSLSLRFRYCPYDLICLLMSVLKADVSTWLAAFSEASENNMKISQHELSAASDTQISSPTGSTASKLDKLSSPSSGVIYAGWVLKKGMLNSWRKRWLVATRWTLTTYKTDKPGATVTKELDLRGVQFVREVIIYIPLVSFLIYSG